MKLFHKHKWEEKERFYAPPEKVNLELNDVLPELTEKLTFGVTTIHFVCECGEHWFKQVFGKKVYSRRKRDNMNADEKREE